MIAPAIEAKKPTIEVLHPLFSWAEIQAILRAQGLNSPLDAARAAVYLATHPDNPWLNGSTAVRLGDLSYRAERIGPLSPLLVDDALGQLTSEGLLTLDGGCVQHAAISRVESGIRAKIEARRGRTGTPPDPDAFEAVSKRFKLDAEQQTAVAVILSEGISVTTGGGGSGKTHCAHATADYCRTTGLALLVAAVTADAAEILSAKLRIRATTLDRLLTLGIQSQIGEEQKRGVVLIDEAKLISLSHFGRLLNQTPPTWSIALIGADDQIGSVGSGAVYRDLLASRCIPISVLTTNHRASGPLIRELEPLKAGQAPSGVRAGSWDSARDLWDAGTPIVRWHASDDELQARLPDLYDQSSDSLSIAPRRNPAKGLGVAQITKTLRRRHFEQTAKRAPAWPARGDRVRFIANAERYVFHNGLRGSITEIAGHDGEAVIEDKNGRTHRIALDQVNRLLVPDYATTAHSAQGRQAKRVIIVVTAADRGFLDASIARSALTRASEQILIAGEPDEIDRAMQRDHYARRVTLLGRGLRPC